MVVVVMVLTMVRCFGFTILQTDGIIYRTYWEREDDGEEKEKERIAPDMKQLHKLANKYSQK